MTELAGGFFRGDRVVCRGRPGTVFGQSARAACRNISVAVQYNDGSLVDERVNGISSAQQELGARDVPLEVYNAPPAPVRDEGHGRPVIPRLHGLSFDESQDEYREYRQQQPRDDQEEEEETYEDAQPEDNRQLGRPTGHEDAREDYAPQGTHKNLFASQPPEQYNQQAAGDEEDFALETVRRNFANLRMAFRALDRNNTGYVARADFFDAMEHVLMSAGYSTAEVDEVAHRMDLGRDEDLSYDEFMSLVEGDQGDGFQGQAEAPLGHSDQGDRTQEVDTAMAAFKQSVERRHGSMREAFRAMDKTRNSALSPTEFATGLSLHGIQLAPNELQDMWERFDPNQDGLITYASFCRTMAQRAEHRNLARTLALRPQI
mmetsp:Transcript_15481/g.24753  ORF Transcript_15481/g.24753 Transcript_15481/m.24753 type:complete len:375 (-) Transcript_15481:210-1334(-)